MEITKQYWSDRLNDILSPVPPLVDVHKSLTELLNAMLNKEDRQAITNLDGPITPNVENLLAVLDPTLNRYGIERTGLGIDEDGRDLELAIEQRPYHLVLARHFSGTIPPQEIPRLVHLLRKVYGETLENNEGLADEGGVYASRIPLTVHLDGLALTDEHLVAEAFATALTPPDGSEGPTFAAATILQLVDLHSTNESLVGRILAALRFHVAPVWSENLTAAMTAYVEAYPDAFPVHQLPGFERHALELEIFSAQVAQDYLTRQRDRERLHAQGEPVPGAKWTPLEARLYADAYYAAKLEPLVAVVRVELPGSGTFTLPRADFEAMGGRRGFRTEYNLTDEEVGDITSGWMTQAELDALPEFSW